jgi:hypothetical protein
VLGCPWRIDFSRALAMLMASSGKGDFDEFFVDVGHRFIPFPQLTPGLAVPDTWSGCELRARMDR